MKYNKDYFVQVILAAFLMVCILMNTAIVMDQAKVQQKVLLTRIDELEAQIETQSTGGAVESDGDVSSVQCLSYEPYNIYEHPEELANFIRIVGPALTENSAMIYWFQATSGALDPNNEIWNLTP